MFREIPQWSRGLYQAWSLKSGSASSVPEGPKTFGRTKKLISRRRLGAQTTWGTNKIQDAERRRKLNIHIEFDKKFD